MYMYIYICTIKTGKLKWKLSIMLLYMYTT